MNATQSADLGFGMQGMAEDVLRIVKDVCHRFDCVTYLEIGVGHGITLAAVADQLRQSISYWRAIGIDLPNGYSLNRSEVARVMHSKALPLVEGPPSMQPPEWEAVTLHFADSHKFIPNNWIAKVHLVLIDGCHGKPCAMGDFLNIEPFVEPGGIVLFHDFGQDQVGQRQPHCPTGLDVRGACRDLGLLDNKRPGWHFNETIIGDKRAGSGDMGVFQKYDDGMAKLEKKVAALTEDKVFGE